MKKIIASFLLAVLFLNLGQIGPVKAQASTIYLSDSGWSDPSVGTWDPVNKIATLTQDVTETIQIDSNNITLDGNGHTVTGTGTGNGVYLNGRTGITIKNLTVRQFSCGIYLGSSSSNTLSGNTASNNYYGIYLYNSNSNNTLSGNTANSNNTVGIYLYNSSNNKIYNNNLISNSTQAYVYGGTGNIFNLAKPVGGNYWSNWTTPDADGDGFVDSSYVIYDPWGYYGGQDNLPWTKQNGWLNRPPVLDPIGNKIVNEGQLLTFAISATDPDGNPLTYNASNLPSGATFDTATRTFSWTPNFAQAGAYANVHFEVSDGSLTDFEDITITVNNVTLQTTVDIDPDTINLKSKGQWITAYIELPAGYDPSQIDLSTVKLNNTVPAVTDPKYGFVTDLKSYITDRDGDGILERMVKLDRPSVQSLLSPGANTLVVSGRLLGYPLPDFEGSDIIRVK